MKIVVVFVLCASALSLPVNEQSESPKDLLQKLLDTNPLENDIELGESIPKEVLSDHEENKQQILREEESSVSEDLPTEDTKSEYLLPEPLIKEENEEKIPVSDGAKTEIDPELAGEPTITKTTDNKPEVETKDEHVVKTEDGDTNFDPFTEVTEHEPKAEITKQANPIVIDNEQPLNEPAVEESLTQVEFENKLLKGVITEEEINDEHVSKEPFSEGNEYQPKEITKTEVTPSTDEKEPQRDVLSDQNIQVEDSHLIETTQTERQQQQQPEFFEYRRIIMPDEQHLYEQEPSIDVVEYEDNLPLIRIPLVEQDVGSGGNGNPDLFPVEADPEQDYDYIEAHDPLPRGPLAENPFIISSEGIVPLEPDFYDYSIYDNPEETLEIVSHGVNIVPNVPIASYDSQTKEIQITPVEINENQSLGPLAGDNGDEAVMMEEHPELNKNTEENLPLEETPENTPYEPVINVDENLENLPEEPAINVDENPENTPYEQVIIVDENLENLPEEPAINVDENPENFPYEPVVIVDENPENLPEEPAINVDENQENTPYEQVINVDENQENTPYEQVIIVDETPENLPEEPAINTSKDPENIPYEPVVNVNENLESLPEESVINTDENRENTPYEEVIIVDENLENLPEESVINTDENPENTQYEQVINVDENPENLPYKPVVIMAENPENTPYEPLPNMDENPEYTPYELVPNMDENPEYTQYELIPNMDENPEYTPYELVPNMDENPEYTQYDPIPNMDENPEYTPYELLPNMDENPEYTQYDPIPNMDENPEYTPYELLPNMDENPEYTQYELIPNMDENPEYTPYELLPNMDENPEYTQYDPIPNMDENPEYTPYELLPNMDENPEYTQYDPIPNMDENPEYTPYELLPNMDENPENLPEKPFINVDENVENTPYESFPNMADNPESLSYEPVINVEENPEYTPYEQFPYMDENPENKPYEPVLHMDESPENIPYDANRMGWVGDLRFFENFQERDAPMMNEVGNEKEIQMPRREFIVKYLNKGNPQMEKSFMFPEISHHNYEEMPEGQQNEDSIQAPTGSDFTPMAVVPSFERRQPIVEMPYSFNRHDSYPYYVQSRPDGLSLFTYGRFMRNLGPFSHPQTRNRFFSMSPKNNYTPVIAVIDPTLDSAKNTKVSSSNLNEIEINKDGMEEEIGEQIQTDVAQNELENSFTDDDGVLLTDFPFNVELPYAPRHHPAFHSDRYNFPTYQYSIVQQPQPSYKRTFPLRDGHGYFETNFYPNVGNDFSPYPSDYYYRNFYDRSDYRDRFMSKGNRFMDYIKNTYNRNRDFNRRQPVNYMEQFFY